MKKVIFFSVFFFASCISIFAQAPESFSYQAVIRNASGETITEQTISIKASINQSNSSGTTVYSEVHTATTNTFGLIQLQIGKGTVETGTFSAINWSNDTYFLKIELDASGGSSYTEMGTSQLLSVPYALHALTVDDTDDADADPANELITGAVLNGTNLEITDAGGTTTVDLSSIADGSATDDQELSLSGNTLSIERGTNTIDLSSYLDNTDNQNLNLNGTVLEISNGTNADLAPLIDDADADSTNELQDLSISGNVLSITEKIGATPIDLAPYLDNTDNQSLNLNGTSLEISNGASADLSSLVNDADADASNEIQLFSVSSTGDTLHLSQGNFVIIPGISAANTPVTPYKRTITIDGTNDFNADETFATTTAGYTGYISWDDNYIYLGIEASSSFTDPTQWWIIYLATYTGSSSTLGALYGDQQPSLPISCNYHIRWKNDNSYLNAMYYSGASWTDATWSFSTHFASSGAYAEIRIPMADIGITPPATFSVHMSLIDEDTGMGWTWGGVPSNSFTDGDDPDYQRYYEFDLSSDETPKNYTPLP